jgi:hypothetical protein
MIDVVAHGEALHRHLAANDDHFRSRPSRFQAAISKRPLNDS